MFLGPPQIIVVGKSVIGLFQKSKGVKFRGRRLLSYGRKGLPTLGTHYIWMERRRGSVMAKELEEEEGVGSEQKAETEAEATAAAGREGLVS